MAARTPQLGWPCAEALLPTLQFKMAAEWAVCRPLLPAAQPGAWRTAAVPTLQDLRPITADKIPLCSPAQGLLGSVWTLEARVATSPFFDGRAQRPSTSEPSSASFYYY